MYRGNTVLAVIPARGGSKGIVRKNLRTVGGKSLIARAAEVVAALPWIDLAVISTDDPAMAAEAERYGVAAPFRRPAELSGDRVPSGPMWAHAWRFCEAWRATRYDISVLLEPTSPLRRPADVDACIDALLTGERDTAVTVSRSPAHCTPEKCLIVDEGGRLDVYLARGAQSIRQNIPAYYHRNGLCYAARRDSFFAAEAPIGARCAAVVTDRPVANVDDELDLDWAEFLLARECRPEPGRC